MSQVVLRATDVTKRADVEALVALAVERFGKLDVFVGNAGIARIGPLDELAVDDWLAMVDVNLNGFLYGVAAALPVFPSMRIATRPVYVRARPPPIDSMPAPPVASTASASMAPGRWAGSVGTVAGSSAPAVCIPRLSNPRRTTR